MLPSYIILKANEDRHVLLTLSVVEDYIEAIVVDNSKYLFSVAEWRSDGIEGQPENCMFKRISSRTAPKIYRSILVKTSSYIIVPWHEPIYIYTMTHSGVILPSSYFKVFKGGDINEKWHFRKPLPLPLHLPKQTKIPSHIVRGFVESAINKKEVCPISLDALVMGHVAMTTCGHLFEKEALMNAINTSCPTCPTCRAVIKEYDIVLI
jgi:hypothetical protein